jgi:hypothetical protein
MLSDNYDPQWEPSLSFNANTRLLLTYGTMMVRCLSSAETRDSGSPRSKPKRHNSFNFLIIRHNFLYLPFLPWLVRRTPHDFLRGRVRPRCHRRHVPWRARPRNLGREGDSAELFRWSLASLSKARILNTALSPAPTQSPSPQHQAAPVLKRPRSKDCIRKDLVHEAPCGQHLISDSPPTVTLSQQADRRPSKAANEAASVPGATEKGPRFLMRYSPHSLVASTQLKMQNGCEKSAVIHGKAGKQRSTETGQSGREEPPVGGRRRWKRKRYW